MKSDYLLRSIVLPCFVFATSVFSQCGTLLAGNPKVEFDVPDVIYCKDVTPATFKKENPYERIVEAKFPITALFGCPDEDVVGMIFAIRGSLPIADFLPKTNMKSDIVGNIVVVETTNKNIETETSAFVGYRNLKLDSKFLGEFQTKSSVTYEKLPAKELVSTSGTYENAHMVYFHLVPSKHHTLKGMKEFTVLFRVPFYWRGEVLEVDCSANTWDRGFVYSTNEKAGARKFDIALCMSNDHEAESALLWLRATEARLFKDNGEISLIDLKREFLDYWIVMLGYKQNGVMSVEARDARKLAETGLNAATGRESVDLERFMNEHPATFKLPNQPRPNFHKNVLKYFYGYIFVLSHIQDAFVKCNTAIDGIVKVKYLNSLEFVIPEDVWKSRETIGSHPLLSSPYTSNLKLLMRRLSIYGERYPESPVFKGTSFGFSPVP